MLVDSGFNFDMLSELMKVLVVCIMCYCNCWDKCSGMFWESCYCFSVVQCGFWMFVCLCYLEKWFVLLDMVMVLLWFFWISFGMCMGWEVFVWFDYFEEFFELVDIDQECWQFYCLFMEQ